MPAKHYLVPDYIINFKCACCTECCKRWRIIIDKQTVEKYDQLADEDEELSAMLAKSLKKDKTGKATVRLKNIVKKVTVEEDGEQKEIITVDRNVCPFLDSEGLCAIQRKHGIDALSDTCKIFPRIIFLTERGYEMALTYACKTAAQTLKTKNMIEFYQDPQGFEFPDLHGQYGKIGDVLERKKRGKTNYFFVEELLIDIMQFREPNIDIRLILTGIVVDKLKDGDIQSIRKYLQNLDADLISQLMSIPSQPVFMMKLVKEAVDKRLFSRITEKDMTQLINRAYVELKLLDKPVIADEKVQKFLDGYNKYYKPYIDNISHIYENYFVNFIFSKKYYTHKYMDAYFLMVFFYILIRFFTVCICIAGERNVDEDMVVAVISAIERSVGHNVTYYQDVLRLIKKGGYHRLPYVISLINL
ncbi:MAG: flagellin lysine-N-methylase [Thermoanaerobacteraceae bacterium]|nr:flagellin lysine-N-methylase [Thermoanaerobacteraceae bacterium]